MTINVHTYYRNRLALEEAIERARVRQQMSQRYTAPARPAPAPRPAMVVPVMVVYGILVGLLYAAWAWFCLGGESPVLLVSMGLTWGLTWGLVFHLNRQRVAEFLQSLVTPPAALPSMADLLGDEEELDLSWMSSPNTAAWTPPAAPAPLAPQSTFAKRAPATLLDQKTPTSMGSMLNQLTETLGETSEPKSLPPKAKVWGTPLEMARK